jgi:outer membrane murein-binding lipoprotein Lpp
MKLNKLLLGTLVMASLALSGCQSQNTPAAQAARANHAATTQILFSRPINQ